MTTERDPRTRIVLSWLREDPPENAERMLLRALDEVDTTPQPRSWRPAWRSFSTNKLAMTAATLAAVLVVAVVGYAVLPRLGALGSSATPSPSRALIARGSLVEHDWGLVEFEATREGSAVTGRMTVGEGRGPEWPLVVELECARTTEDGLILVGGRTMQGAGLAPGTLAGMALTGGLPVRAMVWVGGLLDVPATHTTDCLAYLDAWLTYSRSASPAADWRPPRAVDDQGTVEVGP